MAQVFFRSASAALGSLALFAWAAPSSPAASAELSYERDVRPIFKAACFHCHGESGVAKGELDLRLVRLMQAGGESGAAVLPGDAAGSLLWKKIDADEMPEGDKKLKPEEKAVIREWIAQGAKTLRPEPENVEDARFTPEELGHWAFQPVREAPVPAGGANPVDGFVLAKLRERGVAPSEPAGRRTLVRRLSFDLTGLPPSPAEADAFCADESPDAGQRLADRLLASPQFGARWARHWLDAAGFAETDGGSGTADPKRDHAWRYRDYVVSAFNADKPVDAFIREQLAGDEMIEGELNIDDPRHLEWLTATGFLRMAPDGTGQSNTLADRNAAVASSIQAVSSSLLGLTVNCAQCHDHKYDPIGIDDYYRFRAIFDPAFPLQNWPQPGGRLIDMTSAEVRAERDRIEAEAQKMEADLHARRLAHCAEIQRQKLEAVPEAEREATREAVLAEPAKRSGEQKQLLDKYPMVKPVDFISGLLVEYDGAAHRKFEDEKKPIAELRATKPPPRLVMATTEPPGAIPVSHVLFRGDPESPREAVDPAGLMVLRRHREQPMLSPDATARKTTGRRLAYARQLTDGRHPLAARVFVNRAWMQAFGRGLVATPGDFGIGGDPPSHPELLDWLAADFVRGGWSQKRLVRLFVSSDTYRQRSQRRPELDQIDAENALLGRANLRRLEAEAIRDAILAVSGGIDLALGGPSVSVSANNEGKAVLAGDSARRSLFVEVQRRLPLNMLATFDQPEMTPNCHRRRQTTVATQALWFLNDQESADAADALARAAMAEAGDAGGRLAALYARLFAAPPSGEESEACGAFLAAQEAHFAADPNADAAHRALSALCQVLMASNRFLYLD